MADPNDEITITQDKPVAPAEAATVEREEQEAEEGDED